MAPHSTPMTRLTPGADDADEQRNLRAVQNAGKNVAPVNVRAEPVLRARRRKWRIGKLVGIVDLGKGPAGHFKDDRPGDDGEQQENQVPRADDRGAIPPEALPRALAGTDCG